VGEARSNCGIDYYWVKSLLEEVPVLHWDLLSDADSSTYAILSHFVMLMAVRCWLDNWRRHLRPGRNCGSWACRTSLDSFFSDSWHCCCPFSLVLCWAFLSLPYSRKCLSLFLYLHWREVLAQTCDPLVSCCFPLFLTGYMAKLAGVWAEPRNHLLFFSTCWQTTISVAWLIGWALILEYTIGGSTVARGISPNLVIFHHKLSSDMWTSN
jgi:hypothetical protein